MNRERPPFPRNLVGLTIRRLRKSATLRISQEDLCGRVARNGVLLTRTQIAKIEARKRPVFDYEAFSIAKALKVSITTLYGVNEG